MTAFYNEIDAKAAAWLRELIRRGLIADGVVDERDIRDLRPADLHGHSQCHFFAGIGGWSLALRRAGWPDSRPVWTGSCPCQPFSLAGKRQGFADDRHLWPFWRDLIAQCGPPVVFGEQVASATDWLRLVRGDLEGMGYAVGSIPIEAASAGADHLRDRYWFVADAPLPASERLRRNGGTLLPEQEATGRGRPSDMADSDGNAQRRRSREEGGTSGESEGEVGGRLGQRDGLLDSGARESFEWVIGADGKARRVKPGIRLLAHGVPGRVGLLRGFGNAIDPRPAKAFIEAYLG